MIKIKRVYEEPSPGDGMRILVDRVWPRGISKERARLADWRKDLAPSTPLRKWFGHDPAKWKGFRVAQGYWTRKAKEKGIITECDLRKYLAAR